MSDGIMTLDAVFLDRARRSPNQLALRYFDHHATAAAVLGTSSALAAGLEQLGVRRGDRVGIYLQNVPGFAYALLALWRLGAIPLLLNPMYRGVELARIVKDSQPVGIVYGESAGPALEAELAEYGIRWFMRTDGDDWVVAGDPRVVRSCEDSPRPNHLLMRDVINEHSGRQPKPPDVGSDDVAILAYTSGTTGPSKGAMLTHGGVLHVVRSFAAVSDHRPGDVVLAMAPMFHITGAVLSAALSLLTESTLVLANRFHPDVSMDVIERAGVTSIVASITAYNALLNSNASEPSKFRTIRAAYSGGAPVPESTVKRIRTRLGFDVRNVYGMTETSSAATCVPADAANRVHPETGNLSIGPALPGVVAVVADHDGNPVEPGRQGELLLGGPSIMNGYWRKPHETKAASTRGLLHTGDGAAMDADGWIYLLDRLKDQINVSGYKVWPREVEDVLYTHPAVHEAAVVGHTDEYQGEAVVAYVSLRPDAAVDPDNLRLFVRERLAAYKVPKRVAIVADLPKTETGKIQRNKLRR